MGTLSKPPLPPDRRRIRMAGSASADMSISPVVSAGSAVAARDAELEDSQAECSELRRELEQLRKENEQIRKEKGELRKKYRLELAKNRGRSPRRSPPSPNQPA